MVQDAHEPGQPSITLVGKTKPTTHGGGEPTGNPNNLIINLKNHHKPIPAITHWRELKTPLQRANPELEPTHPRGQFGEIKPTTLQKAL
jgi:hypothetical protein